MTCDCAEKVDAKLREHNTRLVYPTIMNINTRTLRETVVIATMKINSAIRGRARVLLPSFCPFCGKRILKDQKPSGERQKNSPIKRGAR